MSQCALGEEHNSAPAEFMCNPQREESSGVTQSLVFLSIPGHKSEPTTESRNTRLVH